MWRSLTLAVCAALIAQSAAAAPTQTARIEIRGHVPVSCRADFQQQTSPLHYVSNEDGDGFMLLGTIQEFCNASTGYTVAFDYRSSKDPGELLVDGRIVRLRSSGHTIIAREHGPATRTRTIAYRPGREPISSIQVSLRAYTP